MLYVENKLTLCWCQDAVHLQMPCNLMVSQMVRLWACECILMQVLLLY